MNQRQSKFAQRGAINLYLVSFLMMVLTLAALSLMYYMRYGHVPLQDVWQRWSDSADMVADVAVKKLSGLNKDAVLPGQAVTVETGIRRCTIQGKIVFSDVECSDSNPTTKAIKLVDNKGGEPPRISASSTALDATKVDVQSKIIDRAVH